MKNQKKIKLMLIILLLVLTERIPAAGILYPEDQSGLAAEIVSHTVNVKIINGFAAVDVNQTFYNPNKNDIEAVYSFPLPESASLSEFSVTSGEKTMRGEVVKKSSADSIYESEKQSGKSAGKAEKNGYQDFRFHVSGIKALSRSEVRYRYYQKIKTDTGISRFVYPLREGETDDGIGFWKGNKGKVNGLFTVNIDVRSEYPLESVRSPSFALVTDDERLNEGVYRGSYSGKDVQLDKDFVFYYRLEDELPGRIELVPYRKQGSGEGHFMMTLFPGADMKKIESGSDYIFVIDKSGSMESKMNYLCNAVNMSISKMNPSDRFRIIVFDETSSEITGGWQNATKENVAKYSRKVMEIKADQSTNLYSAIEKCAGMIEKDGRVCSVILVTDAVANTGELDPKMFVKLLHNYDVRFFGFLLGNNGNWPLMRAVCGSTGGYYTQVSNDDDILGEIMKVRSKITHEALYDAVLSVDGIDVSDMSSQNLGKVFYGESLCFFGKYKKGGKARVSLRAKYSGSEKEYSTTIEFPEYDAGNPEVERLFAIDNIEHTEDRMNRGEITGESAKKIIESIGLKYQIVTDETSMIVLDDKSFENYGIARNNLARIKEEDSAAAYRDSAPVKSTRADRSLPAFRFRTPSFGGGSLSPFAGILMFLFSFAAYFAVFRKRGR